MSGPIIRKYGFGNFEAIFGTREIPHGRTDTDRPAEPTQPLAPPEDPPVPDHADPGSPPGADATPAEKASEDSAQL